MSERIPQEVRAAIGIGEELVRSSQEVSELVEQFRPAILDHLKQAHDCLGLIIKNYEQGGGNVPGLVVHGYLTQHNENMKEAEELTKTLAGFVLELLKDEQE